MIIPLILFVLFLIIYITISDIFTIFFRLTGLSEEKSRFQVLSLLTNSGFTTAESETIVKSAIRRRIAKVIMLIGYASTVTIVSVIVNIISNMSRPEQDYIIGHTIIAGLVFIAFYYLRGRPFFKSHFDRIIERFGNRIMFGTDSNPVNTLDYYGKIALAQVYLKNLPSYLENTNLLNSGMKENFNVMVMAVKRGEDDFIQASGRTVLEKDDIIIVWGSRRDIRRAFEGSIKKKL